MGFLSSITKPFKSAIKGVSKIAAPIGAAIGGIFGGAPGASIGGSAGAALSGYYSQEDTNEANSAQAQRQMDFQERMSNTSWQRGMKDMRKAGLNPIFAYKTGGASTPQGSQATMINPMTAAGDILGKTSSSAVALAQNKQILKNLYQQGRLTNMQVAQTSANTGMLSSQEDINSQMADKVKAEAHSARSVAKMNEIKQKLVDRDIKYKLANPALMKGEQWNKFIRQILGNVPILGKTIQDGDSTYQIQTK